MREGLLSKLTGGKPYTASPRSRQLHHVYVADCSTAICQHLFIQMVYTLLSESYWTSFIYISCAPMFAATTTDATATSVT
jgi:hypothetical protein